MHAMPVNQHASEVGGVGEGEGGEGVGDGDEEAAGEGDGGFLFVGDFVCDGPDHEEDECAGEEEVACGFGGFFVVVDGRVNRGAGGGDDIFGGITCEGRGEAGDGAEGEEHGCGCEPWVSSFFVDDCQEHGDPCDEEDADGEVDDEGVEGFEGGDWGEGEHGCAPGGGVIVWDWGGV